MVRARYKGEQNERNTKSLYSKKETTLETLLRGSVGGKGFKNGNDASSVFPYNRRFFFHTRSRKIREIRQKRLTPTKLERVFVPDRSLTLEIFN